MTQTPGPSAMSRRAFGALNLVVIALAMVALYVKFTHGYPSPPWTSGVMAAAFGILALQYLLFPQGNPAGGWRYVLPAGFALIGILNLIDALKG